MEDEMAMKRIEAAFTLSLGEFRMASYYGLFLRHRRALQILFGVLLFALVNYVGAVLGLGEPNPLVFLLAGAYLVWGLLLFAGTELNIRRYLRSAGTVYRRRQHQMAERHLLAQRQTGGHLDRKCTERSEHLFRTAVQRADRLHRQFNIGLLLGNV